MTLTRASLLIGLSMLAATAAAWWRVALSGGLVPGPELLTGGPAFLFGLAMTLAAFAYLRGLRAGDEPLTRRHLWLALAVHLCAAPAPPFTSTDALMNLAYGRLANLGLNPYRDPPSALAEGDPYRTGLDWPDSRNAWGPLTVYVAQVVTGTDDRSQALIAFKLLMLIATLAAVGVAWAHVRARPDGASALFFFACNPLLAWELSGQAHNDALVVVCGTVFVWSAWQRRPLLALPSLCLAVATKYGLAPALGLYSLHIWNTTRRQFLRALILGCAAVTALWVPFFDGPGVLDGLSVAATPNPLRAVNSLAALAMRGGDLLGLPLFEFWTLMTLVALAPLAIAYARRVHTLTGVMHDALSFMLLYQILAVPSYWPWYATWLLPIGLAVSDSGLRTTAAVFTALSPALYLTGASGGLAILSVHGVALGLWWRAMRTAAR